MNWDKMALPQADGYDVEQLLAIRQEKWPMTAVEGPTVWNGMVLRKTKEYMGDYQFASHTDPRLGEVNAILQKLPVLTKGLGFVDAFTPMLDGDRTGGYGCSSGHTRPAEVGGVLEIFVTINSPSGGAEGILHEAAHLRLFVLGMGIEKHDGTLIKNDEVARYFSPVRRDCLRPLSAVIHAIMAWTLMLRVDMVAPCIRNLASNVSKADMGLKTIKENIQPTAAGEEFFGSYFSWADKTIAQADAVLAKNDTARIPVPRD